MDLVEEEIPLMLPRLSGSLRSNLRVESLSLQTETFDIFRLTSLSNCSDIKRLGAKLRHFSLFISLNIDDRVFFFCHQNPGIEFSARR